MTATRLGTRRRNHAGFTLPEILAATAIFAMLGAMVFSVLRGSLEVWARGESGRDIAERAITVLDRMAFDLRQTHSRIPVDGRTPVVQFRSETLGVDRDRDGVLDARHQRLVFIRPVFEELTDPTMSKAGTNPLATEYHVGDRVSLDEIIDYLPTGGLAETSYMTWREGGKDDYGSLTLLRAFRSPIGGEGSLFEIDPTFEGDRLAYVPIARGVLYLGFRFRMPSSEGFQDLAAMGVDEAWDSTRAYFPPQDSVNAFGYSQADEGEEALRRTWDDVFPYQVEITLIMARTGREAQVGRLTGVVEADEKKPILLVDGTRFLREARERPLQIKVGDEWMEVGTISSSTLQVSRRGLFKSPVGRHEPNEPVRFGRTYRRVVTLPCYRGDRSR